MRMNTIRGSPETWTGRTWPDGEAAWPDGEGASPTEEAGCGDNGIS